MSPLGIGEVERATGLPCFRAADLQAGLIDELFEDTAAAVDLGVCAEAGAA